jgi:putative nucleic acid modification protein with dual OB domain
MPPAPTYTKSFLCLANSRKPGGHCVAGRTFNNENYTEWLRPVSTRNSHEISDAERLYADGSGAKLLDVIKVTFAQAQPLFHQTENHVIAPMRWEKVQDANWNHVSAATETKNDALWYDGSSSYHGVNDKVPEAIAKTLNTSLMLLEPKALTLVVAQESKFLGGFERRVRAEFTYNNTSYSFVVTDPWIEQKYFALADGKYNIPTSRLCLSLPEILNGNATKLVAAVITPENVEERR